MTRALALARAHAWTLWLLGMTPRWPKRLRYALTGRIEAASVGLVADLAEADALRGAPRAAALAQADARLAVVRVTFRFARDLGLVSAGAHEQGAERLSEIGRLLGGWIRVEREGEATAAGASRQVAAPPGGPLAGFRAASG